MFEQRISVAEGRQRLLYGDNDGVELVRHHPADVIMSSLF